METIKRAEYFVELLELGRLFYQTHKNDSQKMRNFPITSTEEAKMAKDVEIDIRTILFAIYEAKGDKHKTDILMESLTKICEMATENYHDYFEEIKRHTVEANVLKPHQREAIEASLKVLHS